VTKPVLVLGAGGHAKVLVDALLACGTQVLGLTDADAARHGSLVLGLPVVGNDEAVLKHPAADILLVNGIGGVRGEALRREVFERFLRSGYGFATVVHPSAVLARAVGLGEGAQVMAGVIVQAGATIGRNAIINTRASVDHDCIVGDHVHIAPGVTLSGAVTVGDGAHVGTGASVIHSIRIGAGSVVAAGAVVIRDVPDGARVAGIPAKEMKA
jgi:sugar O-acyltransferase (sialic acid O-acetyltransferase NeuD family)